MNALSHSQLVPSFEISQFDTSVATVCRVVVSSIFWTLSVSFPVAVGRADHATYVPSGDRPTSNWSSPAAGSVPAAVSTLSSVASGGPPGAGSAPATSVYETSPSAFVLWSCRHSATGCVSCAEQTTPAPDVNTRPAVQPGRHAEIGPTKLWGELGSASAW